MRGRLMTGIVAGSLLGATAGIYVLNKTTPRQRRRMMRQGAKAIKNVTKVMDGVSSANIFR